MARIQIVSASTSHPEEGAFLVSNPERILELARHQYKIGQSDGAIETLKRCLSMEPDFAEAHALLSLVLLDKSRLYAADLEASMALMLDPELPVAHWAASNVAVAKRDFSTAQRHLDQLMALAPHESASYLLQARLHSLQGNRQARFEAVQKAVDLDPDSPENLSALADYYLETGDIEKAESIALEALRISPEDHSAIISMGEILLVQGNIEASREHAIAALQINPENNAALRLLVSIKARTSPILGLWWRYATWGQKVGPTKNIIILIVAYIIYRISSMIADDLGATVWETGIDLAWLAIVIYSFLGPTIYRRSVENELKKVELKDF